MASEGRAILEKERRLWISGNRLDDSAGSVEPVEVVVVPDSSSDKPSTLRKLKDMFFKQAPQSPSTGATKRVAQEKEMTVNEKSESEKDEDVDTYSGYSLKGEENKYFFSSWSHKK